MRKLLAAVFSIFFLASAPSGHADSTRVSVDPLIDGTDVTSSLIVSRLNDQDGISVFMESALSDTVLPSQTPITIRTRGDQWTVSAVPGYEWPSATWLTEKMLRISGITRAPTDRVFSMIREIHVWQAANPKPEPPVPPEPFDWSPLWQVGIILGWCLLIGLVFKLTIEVFGFFARRRKRREDLLARFESSDPNDLYGQYKPADLGDE